MAYDTSACVGRNNQRALRRMFQQDLVQCATLIAPYKNWKFVLRDEAQGAAQRMTRHTFTVGEE